MRSAVVMAFFILMVGLGALAAPPARAGFDEQADRCTDVAVTDPDAALRLANATIVEAQKAGDDRAVARLRLCRGYSHERADRAAAANAEYEVGVAEGRRLKDDGLLADALVLRGELRHARGVFDAALDDILIAYRLNTRLGRESKVRYTLNAIANLYADSSVADYDRALEYYRKVLAANEVAGKAAEVATNHFNIGTTLEKKGDLKGALVNLRRAKELESTRGDPGQIAYCDREIGIVLTKLDQAPEALPHIEAALTGFEKAGDAEMVAATRLTRGTALRRLGRAEAARPDLEAARAYFEQARSDRFLDRIYDELAQCLAALGEWRPAFEAERAHLEVGRRLNEKQKQEQTSRLRVQFDTERKEQENQALLRENQLQTRVLALAGGLVAALAYLGYRRLAEARRLRILAMTDELTRLPNRRHFLALADDELGRARRSGHPLCVIALDVDRFKSINDRFGHGVGDVVLQRVAHACRSALRPGDHLGRVGGEEFAVLLPRTPAAEAREVAERLRAAVEARDCADVAAGLAVTISGGVAEWGAGDGDFAPLLRRADAALYTAKEGGRNRMELAAASGP